MDSSDLASDTDLTDIGMLPAGVKSKNVHVYVLK